MEQPSAGSKRLLLLKRNLKQQMRLKSICGTNTADARQGVLEGICGTENSRYLITRGTMYRRRVRLDIVPDMRVEGNLRN